MKTVGDGFILKACPFCGGSDIRHEIWNEDIGATTRYECKSCGAIGPSGENGQEAAEKWSSRALEWVPTSERMPKDDIPLVLMTKADGIGLRYIGAGCWHDDHWCTNDPMIEFEEIEYWLMLPDYPHPDTKE